MSNLAKAIRSRRESSRSRRLVTRAINAAPTASMRDELIVIAQRQGRLFD